MIIKLWRYNTLKKNPRTRHTVPPSVGIDTVRRAFPPIAVIPELSVHANVQQKSIVAAFYEHRVVRGCIETGVDLNKLIDTSDWIATVLQRPVPASVSRAGGFPEPRAIE